MTIRPVDPLLHNVPIVDANGCPTPQFSRLWMQTRSVDAAVVSTADTVSTLGTGFEEHAASTMDVHGIADTSLLVLTGDARLTDARVPLAHAASHYSGPDALDLDSIPGTLGASKLYGVGTLAELAVTGEVLAARLAVYDDPEFPGHAAFAVEAGGGGQFYMGDGFSATDLVAGRVGPGVFGTALGVLRADELGGSGKSSTFHLDRANHTGTEPLSALEQGVTGQVLLGVTGAPSAYGQINNAHVDATAAVEWSKLDKAGALPGDVGAAALVHLHAASDINSGNLAYARMPAGTGAWDTGAGTQATISRNLRVSEMMGVGADANAGIGLNFRPTGMTGTQPYGEILQPVFGTGATSQIVAKYVAFSTAAATYTTTNAYLMRLANPAKGAGHTITNLYGLRIEALTQGTTNYALEADNSIRADYSTTPGADHMRFLIYDVTAGVLKRVKRGAADSGGAGLRLLVVDN